MQNIREIILLGTVIYMGICAALPFCLCLLFARCQAGIGRSVALMTFGESVGMATTCAFAVLEMADAFDNLPWWGATLMRLSMGTVAMVSSLHLARSTHRIVIDYENQRSHKDVDE